MNLKPSSPSWTRRPLIFLHVVLLHVSFVCKSLSNIEFIKPWPERFHTHLVAYNVLSHVGGKDYARRAMLKNDFSAEVNPTCLGRQGLQPKHLLEMKRLHCEHLGLDFDSQEECFNIDEAYDSTVTLYSSPGPSTDVDEDIRDSGLKLHVDLSGVEAVDSLVP